MLVLTSISILLVSILSLSPVALPSHAIVRAENSQPITLFSDNFDEYAVNQSVIRNNILTTTFPQWYKADGGSFCDNSYWDNRDAPPPGFSWPKKCVHLDGGEANWEPNSTWYVSSAEAHNGTQSLYLQNGDGPDKVTANFYVSPTAINVGDTVSYEAWYYLGPAFGYPTENANLVIYTPVGEIMYKGVTGVGSWLSVTAHNPLTTAGLGHYYLTTGAWHDVKLIGKLVTATTAQYVSLQIDGNTPFDSILQGQNVTGSGLYLGQPLSYFFSTWIGNPYGLCGQHPTQPINDTCYGDWGDHANLWMYVDDIVAMDLGSNSTSTSSSSTSVSSTSNSTSTSSSTSTTSVTSTTSKTTTTSTTTSKTTISTTTSSTRTSSTTTIPSVTMTVSYSIVGGGSPTPPDFNYVQGGLAKSSPLTSLPTAISVDKGSTWSVTPNPLSSSGSSQQWISSQSLSGTASTTTIRFVYQHQYYLTVHVSPNGAGAITLKSGWVNAGGAVTLTASPNAGHKFTSWSGFGVGNYTGSKNPATITINAPITETANFT